MLSRVLNSQTKSTTFGALLLAGSSFLSSLLGLWRDRLLASGFGAGETLDAYFAAFRLPDFLYGILIAGALGAAFLPLFSRHFEGSEEEGFRFASHVLNAFVMTLTALALLLFLLMPFLVRFLTPGFTPENQELTVSLSRLMLLSPILFGASAVCSAVLQYFQRFVSYALAPLLYNLGIIGGILFLAPSFGALGLVAGVLAGAAAHLAVQLPALFKVGFRLRPLFSFSDPWLRELFFLGLPRALGAAAVWAMPLVLTFFASLFSAGSVAMLHFAANLTMIPVGFIGISFSLAAFPTLARSYANQDQSAFRSTFVSVFRHILFLSVPASLLLFLLRAQIVRLVLGAGEFGWVETRLTAALLGIFAFGILFQALIPLLLRTFFSARDTKIPAAVGILAFFLHVVLIFALFHVLSSSWGGDAVFRFLNIEDLADAPLITLPLAAVVSSGLYVALLLFFLKQRFLSGFSEILQSAGKLALAGLTLSLVTYGMLNLFGTRYELRTFGEVFWQAALAGTGGLAAFVLVCLAFRVRELKEIVLSVKAQFTKAR